MRDVFKNTDIRLKTEKVIAPDLDFAEEDMATWPSTYVPYGPKERPHAKLKPKT